MVLLHGNPMWGFLYRKVATELTGEPLRVIMPDLIGWIASAILIIQLPVLARLAHLTPIDATHWALAAIGSVVVGAMAWLFGAAKPTRCWCTIPPR